MNLVANGQKIGLLGGSFNPAHAGHRYISLIAQEELGLDEIWWLVSPQNPLKQTDDMAPLDARLGRAREIADSPYIKVQNLETQFGTQYTIDTIRRLKAEFPSHRFVWIMGGDNLEQFHRWKNWQDIAAEIPFVVMHRDPPGLQSLESEAAKKLSAHRLPDAQKAALALANPPAWTYMENVRDDHSATRIRAKKPQKWWI